MHEHLILGDEFLSIVWPLTELPNCTCNIFLFYFRDPHGIATKWDKILSVFMIVLAVLSNAIAIYSDAYSLFKKGKTFTQS